MELKKFNEQIWLTEVELDGYQVRGAIILGERDAVLVDTLSHPRDVAPLLPLIQGRELTIIYTHADWDHIWGTGGLPWETARIIGHEACLERFDTVPATLLEQQGDQTGRWDGIQLIRQNIVYLQVLSEGGVPDVFEPMTDFYRHTHKANIGFAREMFNTGGTDD